MSVPEALALEKNQVEESVGTTEALEEYAALAERAGFEAEDITLYRLRAFIREGGLRVYPLAKVEKFLDKKFGAPKASTGGSHTYPPITFTFHHKWGWHPLRAVDKKVCGWEVGREYVWKAADLERPAGGSYTDGREGRCARAVLLKTYNRLIPMPVLKSVADISARFPSVSFIVADYAEYETTTIVPSPRPQDPFLAILGPGIPVMVIERWDEPNFR